MILKTRLEQAQVGSGAGEIVVLRNTHVVYGFDLSSVEVKLVLILGGWILAQRVECCALT